MRERVYDPVRKRLVAVTPEERVRQELLHKMLHHLNYPKGLLAVEKKLGGRRADLICFCNGLKTGLSPLLIIECKAEECSPAAREQVFGYNAQLGAPFVCVAGKTEIHTLWFDGCKIASVPFLPPYAELYQMAQKLHS